MTLFWNGQSFLPVNNPGLQTGSFLRRGESLKGQFYEKQNEYIVWPLQKTSGTGFGPRRVYCSFLTNFYNLSQLFSMEEEIKTYISRSISDIARKCHVYNDEVVKIIKQMLAI